MASGLIWICRKEKFQMFQLGIKTWMFCP